MASIFTFDPDPPRVASPWSTPRVSTPGNQNAGPASAATSAIDKSIARLANSSFADTNVRHTSIIPVVDDDGVLITRLEAEPQDGPTEYKLHLLLRPRRSYTFTSTGWQVSGSARPHPVATAQLPVTGPVLDHQHQPSGVRAAECPGGEPPAAQGASPPATVSTSTTTASQSRQHRLEQLTTQLLWRLQQSSPYHASAANNQIVLPDLEGPSSFSSLSSTTLGAAPRARLIPGLEESKGALYEIGVADDGTLVGLAPDELDESLHNLRTMAASLGCSVEVLRRVPVGAYEWVEETAETIPPPFPSSLPSTLPHSRIHTGQLWVAEAFIKPDIHPLHAVSDTGPLQTDELASVAQDVAQPTTPETNLLGCSSEQLRVSLTGATMCGKSSLLGSLSTATLDNGRGKSRLSLLKHRHEIATGITSSVTQELIGYADIDAEAAGQVASHANCARVINYASGNVSSWTDIHASIATASAGSRLIVLSDSAGHPRYHRTTIRGLVGWVPHWTILCIPADNCHDDLKSGKTGSTPSSQEVFGAAAVDVDLSQTHLELCLSLKLPIVVVVTKLDIASKVGLRQTLSKLLSSLKEAGRKPSIIPDTASQLSEQDLEFISEQNLKQAASIAASLRNDPLGIVPILLTSAVKGTGITKLHALLHELPIPTPENHIRAINTVGNDIVNEPPPPSTLFHIEDTFGALNNQTNGSKNSFIVGGHLRYGNVHIGDELVLGPYPVDLLVPGDAERTGSHPNQQASRSFPGALHKALTNASPSLTAAIAPLPDQEWRRVRVVSLRNLRLPVSTLHIDQLGTIGIVPLDQPISTPALIRVRKGMVLASGRPQARRAFTAHFKGLGNGDAIRGLTVGSAVVVYVASVRASAKVIAIAVAEPPQQQQKQLLSDNGNRENGSLELQGSSRQNAKHEEKDDDDDGFGFSFETEAEEPDNDDLMSHTTQQSTTLVEDDATLVSFQFIASREYVQLGDQVLVMPGGGPGLYIGSERGEKGVAGLDGFVGKVTEGLG